MDYSNSNKRIAKNTILLYIRMLFTLVLTLYMSRVVLEVLGVTDYGIYNVVGGIVGIISFISNSLAASTQRFITYELGKNNDSKLREVFSTSINIHLLIALFLFLVAETAGLWLFNTQMNIPKERIIAASWVYQCSIAAMLLMVISIPYNTVIIAHEKMSAFAYISMLDVSLKLASVFLVTLFEYDYLILYAVSLLCVQLFIRIIYGAYCSRHFEECKYSFSFDKTMFKNMLSFSTWALFGNLAVAGYTHGVNILLNIFFSPIVNAARGITVQVQSAISMLVTNFQLSINPQITKNYAISNYERLHSLVFASSKYSFYLAMIAIVPLFYRVEYVLSLWLVEVPEYTADFVRILCLIQLLDTLANPISAAISATGHIRKYQIVVGLIQLGIVPIAYFFLFIGFSPISVYIVHLSVAIIAQILRFYFYSTMFQMNFKGFFDNLIIRIVPVIIITFLITYVANILLSDNLFSFALVLLITFLSISLSVYFFGVNSSEKTIIVERIKKNKR